MLYQIVSSCSLVSIILVLRYSSQCKIETVVEMHTVDWDKMKTEGKMNTRDQELKSSLKMNLGIGTLEVSGGPK